MIERGASLKETYSDGVSSLVLAVKSGSIDVVKILLAEKVAVNTPFISRVFRDSDFEIYETALTFAIRKGHKEIAKLLIDAGGELPPSPKKKNK
jgi:ankyrin repeat protein